MTADVNNNPIPKFKRFNIAEALAKPFEGLTSATNNCLHNASRIGNAERIKDLLQSKHACVNQNAKEWINERNKLGATPLWLASVMGYVDAVKTLIDFGADLEISDIKCQTPLYAAAKFNHVSCIKTLLEAGANPDGSHFNICTPIYITARDNYPDVMALLIKYGADVNGRRVNRNIDENRSGYQGNLPVYMTLVYRHFQCFRQLVIGGADLCLPTGVNGEGESTDLLRAILRYSCDVRYVKLLALCGGMQSYEIIDYVTRTFTSRSYTSRCREECLKYLQEQKSNPMSLKELIRIKIRKEMGQKRLRKVADLHLPYLISEFLMMSNLDI